MSDERSLTGLWVDTATKCQVVVDSQPEEGLQLVPKGGFITPDVARNIERARALQASLEAQAAVGSQTDPVPPTAPRSRARK